MEDYSRGWVSLQYSIRSSHLQGSKKVPSGLSGQVDLPAGQVTFQSHLPDLQGIGLVIYQLNQSKSKRRLMHRTSKIWEPLLVSKASWSSSFFQAPIYVEIVPLLINKPPENKQIKATKGSVINQSKTELHVPAGTKCRTQNAFCRSQVNRNVSFTHWS